MSSTDKVCQVGDVNFYSDEIEDFRKLRTNFEPRSGKCVLEMMNNIIGMARDIANVSCRPSQNALVEAIAFNMTGIVVSLIRGAVLERIDQ